MQAGTGIHARAPLHVPGNLRNSSVETQSIVVLDFGAQYSQLIARRIREQSVFSVVLPCTASVEEIKSYSPVGIILFGGPPTKLSVWMSHGDEAVELPAGFHLVASSSSAVAAIEAPERKMWAVQFHPEVHHTQSGTDILRNFALNICGAKSTWTAQHFIDATIASVRQTVGQGRAICALSGGVDSAVAATLVDRAMRDDKGASRLTCVFVNNGVLRKNEFEKVQQSLRDNLGLHLLGVDATDRFLKKLAGVT